MRAALYARYSTDNQRVASIADQQHGNRRLAGQLGAHVVRELSDAAISGQAMANRPGLQDLMAMARAGEIDLVICEHTDRLTRDGGHAYDIYYDLAACDVRIVTVNQGEIGLMHVGTSGLMSALFVEELKKKVRRGLEGVVREGRYIGLPAYGYAVDKAYDAAGERLRGRRVIHEPEAAVVRRIFEDAAAGLTAGEIAAALNAEGVPTRGGGKWHKAAIHGSTASGTGLLRNELYRGRLVWGRTVARKDRATGKTRSVPNPAERQVRDAPDLRIVSDELWDRAHARMAERAMAPGARRGSRRGPSLLGGLVRCGRCGQRMVFTGQADFIRCGGRTHHQVECGNTRTPHYAEVESRVLACIRANLLHPDVVAESARAWIEAQAEAQAQLGRARAGLERQLADAEGRARRLLAQVEEGMPWAVVADRHAELTARAAEIRAALSAEPAPVPTILPAAANFYRQAVERFAATAEADPTDRMTAAAREAVRALVDDVTVDPQQGRGQYTLGILANLAPVLNPEGVTMRAIANH